MESLNNILKDHIFNLIPYDNTNFCLLNYNPLLSFTLNVDIYIFLIDLKRANIMF